MVQCGPVIESIELVEICEKIVAHGLGQLSQQEGGAIVVYETWKGFLSSQHSRPKIIELLSERVVTDFALLSREDKCEFVALTR